MKISTPQDWYNLQTKHLLSHLQNSSPSLLKHLDESPPHFLKIHEPEHTFLPWKFITNTPKGTCKLKSNHVLFFQHLERKLRIKEARAAKSGEGRD